MNSPGAIKPEDTASVVAQTPEAPGEQSVEIQERVVSRVRVPRPSGPLTNASTVSKANRVSTLPIDRQLRYGSIQYQINRDVTAGAAWEFMDAGPAPYSTRRGPLAGTLQGHYSTNYLNFVALNVIWKF
jgi:hypothetical protein